MSNRALTWAWSLRIPTQSEPGVAILTSGAKFVLIRLADAANDDFECWPSQELIAAETGISVRSIRDHLELLVTLGLVTAVRITKRNGARKGTRYKLAPLSTSVTVVIATEDTGEDSNGAGEADEIGLPADLAGRDLPVDNFENLPADLAGRAFSGLIVGGGLPADPAGLPAKSAGTYRKNPNFNHHSSSSSDVDEVAENGRGAPAVPAEEDFEDPVVVGLGSVVADRLRARWRFFDLPALLAALSQAGVVVDGLRPIEQIAEEVLLGRVVSPRAVTAYVASAILAEPWRWATVPATLAAAEPSQQAPARWDCGRDGHDWGPSVWAEIDRCVCTRCDQARRDVDPVFAELEAEVRGFPRPTGAATSQTPAVLDRSLEGVS